jgi:hypothetical protein
MESHLAVDEKNSLTRYGHKELNKPFLCVLLHGSFHIFFIPYFPGLPLLVSCKNSILLIWSFTEWEKTIFVARFGVMYTFFPLVSVLLMKALKFISSIELKTQRDRIIPYVVCMIYYWWMWYVLHNQPQYPNEFVQLSLAIFLASIGGLIANISMKVSMHAIAAGV